MADADASSLPVQCILASFLTTNVESVAGSICADVDAQVLCLCSLAPAFFSEWFQLL